MRESILLRSAAALLQIYILITFANAFTTVTVSHVDNIALRRPTQQSPLRMATTRLLMAKITEKEASSAIDKVVRALQKDKEANQELGRLSKTNNILGFGSPRPGIIAVRFNASFQKGGMGRSAIPLPFGLGQSNKAEGRGTMVGQVKASVDANTGKVLDVSVFRDLGYGRSFNLKV
mmetsp:Transcript_16497/g.39499  ORF Transcript_16497/g.39499 Transcript_16497/m.39499 type:complete len:177 (+) Transcript_16497:52-582(+)